MNTLTHLIFSFGILFTSFSVICLGNNPVLSVVFLICTFVLSAIYLVLMGINFIGITYIILYVGAIAVLFLFVIMMLNLKNKDLIEPSSISYNNATYSFILVSFFVFIISSLGIFNLNNLFISENLNNKINKYNIINENINLNDFLNLDNKVLNLDDLFNIFELKKDIKWDNLFYNLTQIETLGQDLYSYGAVLLISLSIILLLAMFATIIISKPNATDPSKNN